MSWNYSKMKTGLPVLYVVKIGISWKKGDIHIGNKYIPPKRIDHFVH
jgi:hypothetical protein